MKSLTNLIYLFPALLILLEITFLQNYNLNPTIKPLSDKNAFLQETSSLLSTAKLEPLKISYRDFQNELEFYLKNASGKSYNVILSTDKSPLFQVTALQKIIKIANIKGQEIHFIDLSAHSPYATL